MTDILAMRAKSPPRGSSTYLPTYLPTLIVPFLDLNLEAFDKSLTVQLSQKRLFLTANIMGTWEAGASKREVCGFK